MLTLWIKKSGRYFFQFSTFHKPIVISENKTRPMRIMTNVSTTSNGIYSGLRPLINRKYCDRLTTVIHSDFELYCKLFYLNNSQQLNQKQRPDRFNVAILLNLLAAHCTKLISCLPVRMNRCRGRAWVDAVLKPGFNSWSGHDLPNYSSSKIFINQYLVCDVTDVNDMIGNVKHVSLDHMICISESFTFAQQKKSFFICALWR